MLALHTLCLNQSSWINKLAVLSRLWSVIWMHLKCEIQAEDSLWQHTFSVWPCLSLSVWVQMNLWRCNSTPGGAKKQRQTGVQTQRKKENTSDCSGEKVKNNKSNALSSHIESYTLLLSVLELRCTWKCSCPGTVLWGNSGRNIAMNAGRLHSALSLSGPTPANLKTCSGMSGALPSSIRRWPRRKAGGARRQRPAGIDRPMLERKPRHPDESSSSDLCKGDRGEGCTKKQLWCRQNYSLWLCGVFTLND